MPVGWMDGQSPGGLVVERVKRVTGPAPGLGAYSPVQALHLYFRKPTLAENLRCVEWRPRCRGEFSGCLMISPIRPSLIHEN